MYHGRTYMLSASSLINDNQKKKNKSKKYIGECMYYVDYFYVNLAVF